MDLGINSQRVPLSGAAEGRFSGDLRLDLPGLHEANGEVKARANGEGWKTVANWLSGHDLLFLAADYQDPLVVLPWSTFSRMVEHTKAVEDELEEDCHTVSYGEPIPPDSTFKTVLFTSDYILGDVGRDSSEASSLPEPGHGD